MVILGMCCSIRGKFKVPVNFHIGNMILAAATNYTVDSVPPSIFGGSLCPGTV